MRKLLLLFFGLMAASCSTTMDSAKKDIKGEEISYSADGVTLKGYLAYDANQKGKRPGILVVHEWWGHTDYVRKRARMLAEMGYTAFALDMYGDGKTAAHPKDAKKFMMSVFQNMKEGKARFEAAHKLLDGHKTTDPAKTAAIGYCFGGAIVLHMARGGSDLKGVASFHGNLSTKVPAKPGQVKAKVLVLHGAKDPMVPEQQVAAFKKEMADANVDMKFIAYPGALHAFTNPAATQLGKKFGIPIAYNKDADQKSWAELKTFLKEIFK
jgi:dienelactone hydrolase